MKSSVSQKNWIDASRPSNFEFEFRILEMVKTSPSLVVFFLTPLRPQSTKKGVKNKKKVSRAPYFLTLVEICPVIFMRTDSTCSM